MTILLPPDSVYDAQQDLVLHFIFHHLPLLSHHMHQHVQSLCVPVPIIETCLEHYAARIYSCIESVVTYLAVGYSVNLICVYAVLKSHRD